MQYPGYLLNPGDMFSVDPEMVLWATGTPECKHRTLEAPDDADIHTSAPGNDRGKGNRSATNVKSVEETSDQIADEVAEVEEVETETAEQDEEAQGKEEWHEKTSASGDTEMHKALVNLQKDVANAKRTFKDISAKRKQTLRALSKDLRTAISRSNSGKVKVEYQKHLEQWLYDILKTIPGAKIPASIAYLEPVDEPEKSKSLTMRRKADEDEEEDSMWAHMKLLESYPNSKPPWSPRPYMSAFAFIPRYLEVNQNVCSAVYLRHPVARPGMAEVPTPFGPETGLLAFQWYLRRR